MFIAIFCCIDTRNFSWDSITGYDNYALWVNMGSSFENIYSGDLSNYSYTTSISDFTADISWYVIATSSVSLPDITSSTETFQALPILCGNASQAGCCW